MESIEIEQRVKSAIVATLGEKINIQSSSSFVSDLGFNSLRMVSLSLALEEEFGQALILNEWMSRYNDPRLLTVTSLCQYISETVEKAHRQ